MGSNPKQKVGNHEVKQHDWSRVHICDSVSESQFTKPKGNTVLPVMQDVKNKVCTRVVYNSAVSKSVVQGAFVLPNCDREGVRLEFPIEQHKCVRASNVQNFMGVSTPIASQLNVEAWEKYLKTY